MIESVPVHEHPATRLSCSYSNGRWHLDEVFVRINRERRSAVLDFLRDLPLSHLTPCIAGAVHT